MLSFKECDLEMTPKYYFRRFIVVTAWDSYINVWSKNVQTKVYEQMYKQKSKAVK